MKLLNNRMTTVVLLVAVVLTMSVFFTSFTSNMRLPDNHQGFEPVQPIAYSHRLHAGELGIDCLHCHGGAEQSRTAGIPPASTCMNCHQFVTASILSVREEDKLAAKESRPPRKIVSPDLQKLYRAVGLNEMGERDISLTAEGIEWIRVHSLPSFVYFNHSAHVNSGVACQTCHGNVETMERVRQVSDLSMGWCVNCHRDANANGINAKPVNASIDCDACHH
jgi:hypothetical protein